MEVERGFCEYHWYANAGLGIPCDSSPRMQRYRGMLLYSYLGPTNAIRSIWSDAHIHLESLDVKGTPDR